MHFLNLLNPPIGNIQSLAEGPNLSLTSDLANAHHILISFSNAAARLGRKTSSSCVRRLSSQPNLIVGFFRYRVLAGIPANLFEPGRSLMRL